MLAVRAWPGRSEQIVRPRPVGEDNVIFSAPEERACNTICSLNGARRPAGGRSRITAATVLPGDGVGCVPPAALSCVIRDPVISR